MCLVVHGVIGIVWIDLIIEVWSRTKNQKFSLPLCSAMMTRAPASLCYHPKLSPGTPKVIEMKTLWTLAGSGRESSNRHSNC